MTSPCPSLRPNCWPWARRSRQHRSLAGSFATAIASKKTLRASEQERSDVRQAREHWRTKRQPRMQQEPHRLVFLDETGASTKMTRLRGRCPKGQRLYARAPFGHWLTQTFVAGLQGRRELGLHIGLKDASGHRPIDPPRRCQPMAAQTCNEGLGQPMAKG